jgi:hypothetical protein
MMNRACESVREIISASLDGEASVIERRLADRHVARCADCRAFAETVAGTVELVRAAPSLVPGRPLSGTRPSRRAGRAVAVRVGAVAAALAAAAGLGAAVAGRSPQPAISAAPARGPELVLASIDVDRRQQLNMAQPAVRAHGDRDGVAHRLSRLEKLTLG